MNILHVINNLGSGGAEKLLTDILPVMKKQGNTVSVLVCNQKAGLKKYHSALMESGIKIIDLNTSFYNPLQIFKIATIVSKGQFDIVHAHLFPTQYWLAIASLFFSKKIQLIKTEHSVFNERKNYKILKPLEQFVYSRYAKIIAITDLVKENLAQWLNKNDKIVVVKNGVNLDQIREEQQKIRLEDYDFLKTNNFNLLMVGRFDFSQKDQKSLVEAIGILKEKKEAVTLYFAGEGPNQKNIKELAEHLGLKEQIHFLGIRSDIYSLMNLVDLNVLSTNHEGLSGVALESLASGKPFIGSDVVGVYDVVPDAGYLFPKQDAPSLAEKITKIKNDPILSNNMIATGLRHVEQYDTKVMVKAYLAVYQSVLN